MTDVQVVQLIYTTGGAIFLIALFAAFARMAARVLWYRRHAGESFVPEPMPAIDYVRRPRLLNRDVVVIGGLCISFGLITAIRFLPQEARVALTTGNIAWALLTTVPAVVAVCVLAFYEYRVIERPT